MSHSKPHRATRLRDDGLLQNSLLNIVSDGHQRQQISRMDFTRYYYYLDGTRTVLAVSTDDRTGRVIFTDIFTRDSAFCTYWLNGQPDYHAIYVGTQRQSGYRYLPITIYALDTSVPEVQGPGAPLTELRSTQLRLELGDIHFPAVEYLRLERAVVDHLDNSPAPGRNKWTTIPTEESTVFQVVGDTRLFFDSVGRTIRYQSEDLLKNRVHWMVSNLDQLVQPMRR